jgi:hypothetical protein
MAPYRKWLVLFHLHSSILPFCNITPWCHHRTTPNLSLRAVWNLICSTLASPACVFARRQERCLSPLCESGCATLHLLFSQHHFIRRRFSSQAMVCIAALLCADWCGIWTTQRRPSASPSAAIQNSGHVFGLRRPTCPIIPAPWRSLVVVALFGHVRC